MVKIVTLHSMVMQDLSWGSGVDDYILDILLPQFFILVRNINRGDWLYATVNNISTNICHWKRMKADVGVLEDDHGRRTSDQSTTKSGLSVRNVRMVACRMKTLASECS
jgi:hypothetical protein